VSSHTPKEVCSGIFTKFILKKSLASTVVNIPIGGTVRQGKSKFGSGFMINLRLISNFLGIMMVLITERKLSQ
jgi:hypothetical protein